MFFENRGHRRANERACGFIRVDRVTCGGGGGDGGGYLVRNLYNRLKTSSNMRVRTVKHRRCVGAACGGQGVVGKDRGNGQVKKNVREEGNEFLWPPANEVYKDELVCGDGHAERVVFDYSESCVLCSAAAAAATMELQGNCVII